MSSCHPQLARAVPQISATSSSGADHRARRGHRGGDWSHDHSGSGGQRISKKNAPSRSGSPGSGKVPAAGPPRRRAAAETVCSKPNRCIQNGPVETLQTLARHEGPRGEVVLRRRTHGAETIEELIVNGVFAMDSSDTTSERRLAELAISGLAEGGRILVGGLGLGYTVRQLLGHGSLDVVEIEECLIDWAYAGLTPTLQAVAADPTVRLHHADLRLVLTGAAAGAARSMERDPARRRQRPRLPDPRRQRGALYRRRPARRVRRSSPRAASVRSGARDRRRGCSKRCGRSVRRWRPTSMPRGQGRQAARRHLHRD